MGLGLSVTDRVGKLESNQRWTNTLLVLGLFMAFVDNKKNREKHQPYLVRHFPGLTD